MSFSTSKIQDDLLLGLTQPYRNYNSLYTKRSHFRFQRKNRNRCQSLLSNTAPGSKCHIWNNHDRKYIHWLYGDFYYL